MKLPQKIDNLIERRARLAWKLISTDHELSTWLEIQGIIGDIEECDYRGGCEMYVNPDSAADRIRDAILKH